MVASIEILLLLLSMIIAVAILARRLNVAPSILLVIAGIVLALVPGLPRVELAPELVLLGVLPPLIYSAGVSMSWREFRFNLRPITLLAVGCVVFTTCAVAAAAHLLLGLPWAIGFLLGAIVAPPDVVAPLAIARRLGLPRRLLVVLEGEGLANDATALILYRFAVAAASTGTFSLPVATGTFILIVIGEIVFGIGVGWLSLRLRRWARDPRVEITMSLMTPYFAYWVPEHLGGSGVLATVAAGLYVSWNGPLLIPSTTRLQGIFFWDLIIYLIEGMVFLITGLQARTLIDRVQVFSIAELMGATVMIAAIVIVARFVWVFPGIVVPRWISPRLRKHDPTPPWQWTFVLAFTGVRGVVSLAAALAIPFSLASGELFPYRDFILFVTFGIIVITLIGLGLMLPMVIRWLGLAKHANAEHQREAAAELTARYDLVDKALAHIDGMESEGKVRDDMADLIRQGYEHRRRQLPRTAVDGTESLAMSSELKRSLISVERQFLYQMLREGRITDEARRRIERDLDLVEAAIELHDDHTPDPPL